VDNVIIRRATIEDAAEIANVNVNTWRESYQGLLPQDYLDDRPLQFKNIYRLWKKIIADETQITLVADCEKNGIVGFVYGKDNRDPEFENYAEVYAIYLFKKYHGKKIGFELLKQYFESLKLIGYEKAYLWVLKDNPTIKFYEKMGAQNTGDVKEPVVGSQIAIHHCYSWSNLNLGSNGHV